MFKGIEEKSFEPHLPSVEAEHRGVHESIKHVFDAHSIVGGAAGFLGLIATAGVTVLGLRKALEGFNSPDETKKKASKKHLN